MAGYTFLDLYTAVGNKFDSQSGANSKLWVNDAIHMITSMRRWSWSEITTTVASVSGQQDYVLTGTSPIVPDFDGIIDVRHNIANASTSFVRLMFMKQPDFDEYFAASGATAGIPAVYTIRGAAGATTSGTLKAGGSTVLSVFPVMNYIGSFKIATFRSAGSVELTADGDIPLPPVQFKRAIIELAIAIGKADTDQYIASNVAMQIAQQALQALESADLALRGGDKEDPVSLPANAPGAVQSPSQTPYGWEPPA